MSHRRGSKFIYLFIYLFCHTTNIMKTIKNRKNRDPKETMKLILIRSPRLLEEKPVLPAV